MQDFKQLRVWQLSREFVSDIYKITDTFPKHELHSMVNQLRRASYSVPSNVAEGSAKGTKEFARYLLIAQGSIKEIEAFLLLAYDLRYITNEQLTELTAKLELIAKMNYNLIKKINKDRD